MMPRTAAGAAPTRETYFFLSYAHSAPVQSARTDTDVWVGRFFADLSGEVARLASPRPGVEIGFIDQYIPPGADMKAALAGALGAAQVFVPLYSPGYFNRPWALGEQESFLARLDAAADAGSVPAVVPSQHVVPVLWIPVPSWEDHPELDAALDLGRDVPAYAENGMRALCMLGAYRRQYQLLLGRLAWRIVEPTRRFWLRPSRAPALDEVSWQASADPAFVVAVLAPTRDQLPEGRQASSYADRSLLWRPFGARQELPLAEYVASTAERLGLPVRTTDFADAEDLLEIRPGVVLIDPWITERPEGLAALRAAARALPPWAVPLLVTDADDPRDAHRGADLARLALGVLQDSGATRARWVGRMDELAGLMPTLVTEARRLYLKHGAVFPASVPNTRPPSLRTPVSPPIEAPEMPDEH
ncbi:TIR-like protein FxsC [Micromonospora sp. NPDC000663]|uniref:TIR-like protein FxsC n=1 Tax=Micromonospora sp. NPDC000663 TaxID=3364218 RepID=UPI00369AF059